MKAIRYRAYGGPDVLELQDLPTPAPGDGEVLIRVHAAAINPGDSYLMRGIPRVLRAAVGLTRPRTGALGADLAGRVEAVGRDVTSFRPGDEVFGCATGAFAEYVTVRHDGPLVTKPAALTFEEAAAVPTSAVTALIGLRDVARVGPGQRVLVNGASGGVGGFAVQLARSLGAEVTAVCRAANADLVRSLGAAHVVDHTKQDFTDAHGPRYDVILDNVGNRPLSACARVLAPRGTYIPNSGKGGRWLGPVNRILAARLRSLAGRQRFTSYVARPAAGTLTALRDLLDKGELTAVIDRTYPLADAAAAMRHYEEGHPAGKVVLTT
ncbi:NAD(P)-dependent alcohol dehydrogenase [Actinomadura sp. ATCC 31491]|uniref:NAD(P)-dependent alcohol dehydrogenase n=1 Tax=Actinomadura luzonensis TaxID=2805427 RepID=A0ABT0GBB5_9ACTN|nr:NAD(P)-dependent alcohol dehydrogenase [Actinomadura luzonensis]MCK2221882.1 NAD(P)-dependent alcohol dehydrogenase [Actinomadura luzonensis]